MTTSQAERPSYHFVTDWRVEGTLGEVSELLFDGPGFARWWPSVYLEVDRIAEGDQRGVGSEVAIHTKGFLPYHLRWTARIVEADLPHAYTLEAVGDFVGRGTWTFRQDGAFVDATYDWEIGVANPLLRRLSFIARPAFGWNHRWAMARGLESLELELARRHAATDAQRDAVPAPPGPTPDIDRRTLVGVTAVLALFVLLGWRRRP
jgi:hypothetical protein